MKLAFKNGEEGLFTSIFKRLYEDLSINPFPVSLNGYPSELECYIKKVYDANKQKPIFNKNSTLGNKVMIKTKEVLVGFTSGKDSLAATLSLIEMGYSPILYHMKGVNRSYPHELEFSRNLAEKLNLELIEVNISISGKCEYKEHPIKNQFILSNMVDYGIKRGIANYSMGNVKSDFLDTQNIEYNLSDAIELFQEIEKFYKNFIPNFAFLTLLDSDTHSFEIVTKHAELLDYISSCILPTRYKKNARDANIRKYGESVKFMNGRCGSCYKCAMEYIHLILLKVIEKDEDYYKHCMKILKKCLYQQFPSYQGNINTDEGVLRAYIDLDSI